MLDGTNKECCVTIKEDYVIFIPVSITLLSLRYVTKNRKTITSLRTFLQFHFVCFPTQDWIPLQKSLIKLKVVNENTEGSNKSLEFKHLFKKGKYYVTHYAIMVAAI